MSLPETQRNRKTNKIQTNNNSRQGPFMNSPTHNSYINSTVRELRSFIFVDTEDGARWLSAGPFMHWLCDKEHIDDSHLRRELCKQAIAVFREDGAGRPKFAILSHRRLQQDKIWPQNTTSSTDANTSSVSGTTKTPVQNAKEPTVVSDTSKEQPSPEIMTVLNLQGFLFFIRALKSITSGYTVIDELYKDGASVGTLLFLPPLHELQACLALPPPPQDSPVSLASQSSLSKPIIPTPRPVPPPPHPPLPACSLKPIQAPSLQQMWSFAPSLPPRQPASSDSASVRYHPFKVPAGRVYTSSPNTSSTSRPTPPITPPPHYNGTSNADRRTAPGSQSLFRDLMPPLIKHLQSVPIDVGAKRFASGQANEALACAIILQLSKFISSSGKPVSDNKIAVRELLSDLHHNPTLVPALRGARLSCSELMTMDRAVHATE